MKKSRFTETQVISIQMEYYGGMKAEGMCRRHGISKATLFNWCKKYAGMEAVAFAVRWHYPYQRIVPTFPHLLCLQLLQDADALDRVRFGGQDAIRTEYLHFPVTVSQMDYAERLFLRWA
jgi:hypothetical protein